MRDKLLRDFERVFGDTQNAKVYFAPGRVNLIGEHTDYNGGHVFPCALSIGIYAVARKRKYSENNYNGVKCGIMDQFAVAMGKKNNAIFLV